MYPYDFEPTLKGLNPEEVFVVMPFASQYDIVFTDLIEPSVHKVSTSMKRTLRPYRTKNDPRTTSGWLEVLEHLYPAQVVLGVLTKHVNANVNYELGIAHATQPIRRQVLIAEKDYDPGFDTKDLIFMRYDPSDPAMSVDDLARWIENAISGWSHDQEQIVLHAIAKLSPFDFEVVMLWGRCQNFAFSTSGSGPDDYERKVALVHGSDRRFMEEVFERHCNAIARLQQHGFLGLATNAVPGQIGFSYWWTDLGNIVLSSFKIISEADRRDRYMVMPPRLRRIPT